MILFIGFSFPDLLQLKPFLSSKLLGKGYLQFGCSVCEVMALNSLFCADVPLRNYSLCL